MKKLLYTLLFLVILVFGLTFAAQNPQSVSISYYFDIELTLPLTLFLLMVLVLGVVIGVILSYFGRIKRARKKRVKAKPNVPAATALAVTPNK